MNWWTQLSTTIKPEFKIWNIQFHFYGLIIGLALILGIYIAQKRAHQYKLGKTELEYVILWTFIPALVGARLYHVLDFFNYYTLKPFDIVAIWKGGLGIYGALIGGFLGLAYASYKKHIKLFPLLDLLLPSIILMQALGRWGNYFNQEAFGPPTNLPWKIYISFSHRISPYLDFNFFHPLFLYEFLWNLTVFIILIWIAKRKPISGTITGWYLILYGLGRFVIEFGRLDTAVVGGIKVAQVLSLGLIILGVILLFRRHIHLPLLKSSSNKK